MYHCSGGILKIFSEHNIKPKTKVNISISSKDKAMSTKIDTSKLVVEHDEKKKKFYIRFDDGEEGCLDYRVLSSGELDYCHTYTPPSKRGNGIAAIVSTAAFEYALNNDKKVIPSCWYLKDVFLKENTKYNKTVSS